MPFMRSIRMSRSDYAISFCQNPPDNRRVFCCTESVPPFSKRRRSDMKYLPLLKEAQACRPGGEYCFTELIRYRAFREHYG